MSKKKGTRAQDIVHAVRGVFEAAGERLQVVDLGFDGEIHVSSPEIFMELANGMKIITDPMPASTSYFAQFSKSGIEFSTLLTLEQCKNYGIEVRE